MAEKMDEVKPHALVAPCTAGEPRGRLRSGALCRGGEVPRLRRYIEHRTWLREWTPQVQLFAPVAPRAAAHPEAADAADPSAEEEEFYEDEGKNFRTTRTEHALK